MIFKILRRDKKTKARIGIIQTKKGKIETPFFMPVATKASVKYASSQDLESMDAKAVISNAFILSLRPGAEIIKRFGGIGNFMNFRGMNVTDSGGFQMYSDSIYIKSTDKGIFFKNPFSCEKLFITPEQDMKIQLDLNSEIAMCLDSMPLYEHSKEQIAEAVRKTTLWATRCKKEHDKLQKNKKKKQLLFGITQGGIYKDLREQSILALKQLNFDGYSIGGLGLGEKREDELEMIKLQKSLLPENKPIYLMGIGNPVEILEAISLGVDMFDSRMPTQSARHGTLFTSKGKLKLLRSEYKNDKTPIDKNCNCFVCKNYSKAYLRYLLIQKEGNGKRLVTYHNLYYLQNLMKQAKEEIKHGKFLQFKNKIKKIYSCG